MNAPRLKRFLTIFPLADDRWVLRGGTNELCRVHLRNERAQAAFGELIPLLDGGRDEEGILREAEARGVPRDAARALLDHLERSRCLEEANGHLLSADESAHHAGQLVFFSHFTSGGGAAEQARLAATRIDVAGERRLAQAVRELLTASGFAEPIPLEGTGPRALPAGEATPHAVVLAADHHDYEQLAAIDEWSRVSGRPWLLIRVLSAREAWVGPLFVPGDTASYRSFEARLRGQVPLLQPLPGLESYFAGGVEGLLPAQREVLAGVAVTELVKLFSGYQVPHLAGRFLAVDLATWDTESHDVWRIPRLDGDAALRPHPFPWKEALYGQTPTNDRRG
ncbi:MAG TPA: hypothetical protein VNJ70_07270 [Thermoanaerobaculia bacterium]|nr:hypothetical protein [Thermoanaerobaculia bacterium]